MALDRENRDTRGEIVCVAVDGQPADAAAAVGADLSRRLGRPFALVDVQVPVPPAAAAYPPVAPAPPLPEEPVEPPRPVPRDLEALARAAGGSPVRYETRVGTPADVLVAVAGEPRTTLLVAEDDGSGAFASALGGNPARQALRRLSRPVVLVPPACRIRLAGEPTIVAAVPDGDELVEVVGLAADLAAELGGRLVLAHARAHDGDHDAVERARAAVPGGIRVQVVESDAKPAEAVEATAEQLHADLVVVGPPSHGPVLSALLGSTTHHVAAHAHVPVVVVPGGAE